MVRQDPEPVDEWNRNTADIGSPVYGGILIEVISQSFKKNQNVRFLIVVI